MAMIAMVFGGVAGMSAFLVSVLFLEKSFLAAAQLYFATGIAVLLLVCVWRMLGISCDKLQQDVMRVTERTKLRR